MDARFEKCVVGHHQNRIAQAAFVGLTQEGRHHRELEASICALGEEAAARQCTEYPVQVCLAGRSSIGKLA